MKNHISNHKNGGEKIITIRTESNNIENRKNKGNH